MSISKKYSHINFTPPKDVQQAAKRGLDLRREYGRGGLSRKEASEQGIGSGVQRATNLANGDQISPDTIRRMVSFFARHEKNKDSQTESGEPGAGMIAWLIWGGDPGKRWANKVNEQMKAADMKNKSLSDLTQQIIALRSQAAQSSEIEEKSTVEPIIYKAGNDTVGLVERIGARHTSAECGVIQKMHDLSVELGALCHRIVKKAGARHSHADRGMVQRIHDDCIGLGAACPVKGEQGDRDLYHSQIRKENGVTKSQSDAPNYLPASTPQRCEICAHFRGDPGEDYCTRFEFAADPDYVCDDWKTGRPDEIPGYMSNKADLADLAGEILELRLKGGRTSGNWAHQGRPGKKGGSRRGAGFKAIGVRSRPGLKRKDVKRKAEKAKNILKKDTKTMISEIEKKSPGFFKKTKPKDFYSILENTRKLPDGLASTGVSTNKMTLSQAQALSNYYEKQQAGKISKAAQAQADKKPKSAKDTKGKPQIGDLAKTAIEMPRDKAVKEYEDFHRKATPEENKAMIRYQSSGYKLMNGHLRLGHSISDSDLENIKQLDKAIDKAPRLSQDSTLYRGTSYQVYASQLGDDPSKWIGKTFEDKGYMSTSRDPGQAFSGVPAEVRAPKGTKTVYFGNLPNGVYNHEEEFLMARGTKMVITGIDFGGPNNNWVQKIYTEIIDQP